MKKRTWVIINHDPEQVISRLHLSKQVLCSCMKQRLNFNKAVYESTSRKASVSR